MPLTARNLCPLCPFLPPPRLLGIFYIFSFLMELRYSLTIVSDINIAVFMFKHTCLSLFATENEIELYRKETTNKLLNKT